MPVPYQAGMPNRPSGYGATAPQYYGDMRRWAEIQDFVGGRMDTADQDMGGTRNQFQDAIMQMRGFNPSQFLNQASTAAFNNISRDFGLAESQRKAGLNRRGLVSDVGGAQAQTRFHQALANALGGLAMQTGQMTMDRDRGVASAYQNLYGSDLDRSNMYFDALYGASASRKAQDFQQAEAKRNRKTALIGGAMSGISNVAGAAIPFM
jgi:hypothetical protein